MDTPKGIKLSKIKQQTFINFKYVWINDYITIWLNYYRLHLVGTIITVRLTRMRRVCMFNEGSGRLETHHHFTIIDPPLQKYFGPYVQRVKTLKIEGDNSKFLVEIHHFVSRISLTYKLNGVYTDFQVWCTSYIIQLLLRSQ